MPKSASKTSPKSPAKAPRKTPKTPKKSTPKSTGAKSPKKSSSHLSAIGVYDRNQLTKDLKIDAKALAIPAGAAQIFIDRALDAVEADLKPKKIITERDLKSAIAKELKQFNPDFAYIYQNRDKII